MTQLPIRFQEHLQVGALALTHTPYGAAAAHAGLAGGRETVNRLILLLLLLFSRRDAMRQQQPRLLERLRSVGDRLHTHTFYLLSNKCVLSRETRGAVTRRAADVHIHAPSSALSGYDNNIRWKMIWVFYHHPPPPLFSFPSLLRVCDYFFWRRQQLGGWDHVAVSMAIDEPLEI